MKQTISYRLLGKERKFFCTWKRTRTVDFVLGVIKRYPMCCVLRYSLGKGWKNGQARRRGIRGEGEYIYVPCGVFHKAERQIK